MTSFQIITIIIAALGLLGGIIAVYIKTQVDIAKIQVELKFLQRDLNNKEISIIKVEKTNREDHQIIFDKLDKMLELIKK